LIQIYSLDINNSPSKYYDFEEHRKEWPFPAGDNQPG